jgi:palmitoyltransferase
MLLGWHLYLIVRGETSIEGHDNDYFMKKAKERGMVSANFVVHISNGPADRYLSVTQIYINPYDLGKRGNLEFFFNVGPGRL